MLLTRDARTLAVSKAKWSAALESLASQIGAYHKAAPHSQGLKADQIRRTGVVPKEWLDDALAALAAAGSIAETGGHFHEPNHRAALPPDEAAVFKRIQAAIRAQDQPPSIGDIAKSLGMPLRSLDALINRLAKLGFLTRAGDHRVLLPDQLAAFVATAQRLARVATERIHRAGIPRRRGHRSQPSHRRARVLRPLRLHAPLRRLATHRW